MRDKVRRNKIYLTVIPEGGNKDWKSCNLEVMEIIPQSQELNFPQDE